MQVKRVKEQMRLRWANKPDKRIKEITLLQLDIARGKPVSMQTPS
jgi:hypothetical protein